MVSVASLATVRAKTRAMVISAFGLIKKIDWQCLFNKNVNKAKTGLDKQ